MPTVVNVDGGGRACLPFWRRSDPSLYRAAHLWNSRLMARRFPPYPPQSLCPTRILLPIQNRVGRKQKTAVPSRPISRRPIVLRMSRVPLSLSDPVRRRRLKYQVPPGATEEFMYFTGSDIDLARRCPLCGCTGNPPSREGGHIFTPGNLRGLPKDHVITRGGNLDLMAAALTAAGAIQAEPRVFLGRRKVRGLGTPTARHPGTWAP